MRIFFVQSPDHI